MTKRAWVSGWILLALALHGRSADDLRIRSPAPPLDVAEWLTDAPAAEFDAESTHAVVFLSSRAPGHPGALDTLLRAAGQCDETAFTGIYTQESEPPAKLLRDLPANLSIGMDRDQTAAARWMYAAGQRAIPTAFLVKRGLIVWIGPLSSLEAAMAFVPRPALPDDSLFPREQWLLFEEYIELVGQRDTDPDLIEKYGREIARRELQDAGAIKDLAVHIIRHPSCRHRDCALALRLIERALALDDPQLDELHDLQAAAHAWLGDYAQAVAAQQRALELNPANLHYAISLEHYQNALDPDAPLHLRVPRFGHAAAVVGTNAYIIGGWSAQGPVSTIESFHAASARTELIEPDLTIRRFHSAVTRRDCVYIVGGIVSGGQMGYSPLTGQFFEEFNPASGERFFLSGPMQSVLRPGCVVAGNRLYLVGGAPLLQKELSSLLQIFDFTTHLWRRGAELPIAREGQAFHYNGKIFAPGGYNGRSAIADFQVYDPPTDTWSLLPPLPQKTSAFQGLVLGDQLYLFGDFDELDRMVAYDFTNAAWSQLELPYKPARHAVAVALGDEVFVIGGNVNAVPPYRSSIQRYSRRQLETAPRIPWTQR